MREYTCHVLSLVVTISIASSLVRAQTYCDTDSNDGWCSNDLHPSMKTYVSWLTATCLTVFFLLWFDKKLMCLVVLWWLIALAFIYVQNSMVWSVMNVVNIVIYFWFFRGSSDTDDDDEQQLDNQESNGSQPTLSKPKVDRSWLDPFGEHKTQQLLYDVIDRKLKDQKEQKMKQMAKNKSQLLQEIERKRREVSKFTKQEKQQKRNENNSLWIVVKWIFGVVKRSKAHQSRNKYRVGIEADLQTTGPLQTVPQQTTPLVVKKNIDLKSPTYR
mmetsp:Transcript_11119/g.16853  ORF Transcript_11119/g.16853 Transcript_11119/m.16853 type:complete len:272 (-) Transcript_11119:86-901(-)